MGFEFNQEIGQRYQLKEKRGEGTHGTVFRAYDSVRKGEVAVKLFNDGALDVQSAEAARHFQVADSGPILPLLEVHPEFIEGPTTVMPLAAGTFADPGSIFSSTAVHTTRRVLTALEFCHGRHVIHGDVKPSNIFRDKYENVMLGDFGVGGYTPEYAAPELFAGGEKAVATDLWAVAVSFYEMLCAELPFGARPDCDEQRIATRVAMCDYVSPDERLPFLPLRFRSFFRSAFAAEPAKRGFATAAAMRNALAELPVRVEWVRVKHDDSVVCFEGHEVASDARRTGTTFDATIIERPRKHDFLPEIKKIVPGQPARRLTGLPRPHGLSKPKAGQQLSVWMRHLTEAGDFRG